MKEAVGLISALISCIILMGDVFTIHCKSVGADSKNVILALHNYLILAYTFPELHTGNGKTYHETWQHFSSLNLIEFL